jgi:hypothetical protein
VVFTGLAFLTFSSPKCSRLNGSDEKNQKYETEINRTSAPGSLLEATGLRDMKSEREFLKVDLQKWIEGTIEKHERGHRWNSAWTKTYKELGGKSEKTGSKGCPMTSAKTLYKLGRIIGHGTVRKMPLSQVSCEHSKNGAYAIAAIELLTENSKLNLSGLWTLIQERIRAEIREEPAISNQGGPTLTYKLWKLGLIR